GFRAAAVVTAEPASILAAATATPEGSPAPPDTGPGARPTDRVPDWDPLLAECRRTVVALQIDQPSREPGDVLFVALTETRRAAVAELAARWPGATVLDEGSLPTLAASLSLEQAQTETRHLNLLPSEWRERRRRARARRLLIRAGIAVIVVYALGLLGLIGARTVRQARFAGLQRQVRVLEPASRRAAQLESELLAMQRQLSGQASALEILREISALLPDNVKLTSFVFRRDESVAMRGQADSAPSVYDFVGKLEQSPLFSQVVPGSVAAAGDLTKFDLVATLATAAPTTTERP
ncbi:PilN domain-containing protein, partial [bacterium]|nr:PilN domain-containing protein [bacterium]